MPNFFRKLFLPAKPEYKIFMSGLDAAGKTTILYKLKLGEIVTTIPTIGFNVETLEYKGFNWTAWDVGGWCDKIRPLYRHYFPNTNALFYIIDSTDRDRLPETLKELDSALTELIENNTPTSTSFACVAIILNKQDLPNAMSLKYFEEQLTPIMMRNKKLPGGEGVEWSFNPVCALSGDGLYEVLDWLNETMSKIQPAAKKAWAKHSTPLLPHQMPPTDLLIQRIKEVHDDPEDPDAFMEQFGEGLVTPFDHRAHVRAGFLILVRCRRRGVRDPKAVDEFIVGLRRFFEKAGNRLRNTFNITMTIFWCHAIHAALTSYTHSLPNNQLPTDDAFPSFLLHAPHLMWSGLWTKHYSKDRILTKEAATNFVLPDKRPLETYVVLQDAAKLAMRMEEGAKPIEKGKILGSVESGDGMGDETFWKKFEAGMLDSFGVTDIVRVAYLTVKGARKSGERRGVAVKRSMDQLQSLLVRLRSTNPSDSTPIFSETQFYFYIQIIDATIVDQDVQILDLSFRSFTSLFPELLRHDLYKRYYSDKVWSSIESRVQFSIPDIKPLPNRFDRRDLKDVKEAVERDKRPTIEELKVLGGKMVGELEGWDDEEFLKAVGEGRVPRFTHGVLLRFIWLHIRRVKDGGERRSLGTSRILDGIDEYFANRKEAEASDESGEEEGWKAHKGLTHVTFWIQMVTGALVGARRVASLKEFAGFLEGAPELVWEGLWRLYYSEEVMESVEAKALFVPPDVRKLPSYVI
ncbi:ubiquitinyl hydrolase 1 [Rhizophlyctis rosea]|uniref:ADP-ribosylation factor n=1 Tax=Rhizophlyctis rosea TaxID=64517 RepID=A0AAD5X766_9FUNG|nr:ubiquitinyl hydrolase 1 [Rhizophlyctis rosea]